MTIGCRLTKRLLGHILVDGEFVSPHDLEAAVEKQKQTNQQLGEILVEMGVLNPAGLRACLAIQRDLSYPKDAVKAAAGVRMLLGELLLKAKRITQEQLELALQEQNRTGEKLGEIFVRSGMITQEELDAVLTFQKYQSGGAPASERFRLGEILVSTNHITREQLEDALSRQKFSKKKIGELLIEAGYVQPHQVEHGLKLQEKILTAALISALSFSAGHSVQASGAAMTTTASSKVSVTATVQASAILKVQYQNPEIVITNGDIERGYVEVRAASRLEVKNNSRAGYLLVFEGLDGPFRPFHEVHVHGLGREVQMDSSGGLIQQPYMSGTVELELSYRFILSKNAPPGTYEWPLLISAQPL
jgi:hypothetical protein